jgi:hypothetical protein
MFSDPFTAPAAGPAPLESTRNTLIDTNCPLRASDGRALRPVATQEWSTRFGAVFAAIGVILAGLSISLFVISPAPRLPMLLAMDLLSAVALGAQATAARLGGQGHHDGGGHVAAHRIGYGRIGDRCQAGLAAPGVGARVDQRRCAGRRGGTVRASRLGLGLSAVIMMARPTTAKPTGPSRHGRGRTGSRTRITVPTGVDSIPIRPPCRSSTILRETSRPRPVPSPIALVVKNGSNA